MNTVVQVLKAAKTHLTEDKWIKGNYSKDFSSYDDGRKTCCSQGAVNFVCNGCSAKEVYCGIDREAVAVLNEVVGRSIIDFNDHPNTTYADIMNTFDKAIAFAEKEGL